MFVLFYEICFDLLIMSGGTPIFARFARIANPCPNESLQP